jgi:hypothetical protein
MSEEKNDIALVKASELAMVPDNFLNTNQLKFVLKRTPKQYVRKRAAKGGGTWDYVSGGYVKKALNLVFGWDWTFRVLDKWKDGGECIVHGQLTVSSHGVTVIKEQFGNKEIIYRKQKPEEVVAGAERIPLSIGNDYKSACTDALKKCAAELGFAADIYNKEEFKEVQVVEDDPMNWDDLRELFDLKKEHLTDEDRIYMKRVIDNQEQHSFSKVQTTLKAL